MKEGLKPDKNYPQVLQETIWVCQKGLKNLLIQTLIHKRLDPAMQLLIDLLLPLALDTPAMVRRRKWGS